MIFSLPRFCFPILLFAISGLHLPAQNRPNIVHIFADDLGKASVGVHGQLARQAAGLQHIKTPHLDSLANAGMTFNHAYAATLCSPSRAMLYFGFSQAHNSNDRNTVNPRAQDVSVAEVLAPAGYTSAVFGKWGFGGSSGSQTSGNENIQEGLDPLPDPWELFAFDTDLSEVNDLCNDSYSNSLLYKEIANNMAADLDAWLTQNTPGWQPSQITVRSSGASVPFPPSSTPWSPFLQIKCSRLSPLTSIPPPRMSP